MPTDPKPPSAPGKPATGAGSDGGIKGKLTRKVGPLPVWGWAAVGVGGFVAWRLFSGGGSASSSGGAGVPSVGGVGGGGGGGGGYATPDPGALLEEAATAIPTPGGGTVPDGSGATITAPGILEPAFDITPDPIQEAIANLYAGTGYEPPTIAGGPYPSADAFVITSYSGPADLLQGIRDAMAAGYGQVVLPSGEHWSADPGTAAQIEQNIARIAAESNIASGSYPTFTEQPQINSPTIPALSTSRDYSPEIATLQGYIANLNTGTVTLADREKIALYQARITEYAAR